MALEEHLPSPGVLFSVICLLCQWSFKLGPNSTGQSKLDICLRMTGFVCFVRFKAFWMLIKKKKK